MASHTAKVRAYKTAEGDRVVAEGDPAAATLYCTPGRQVDKAEADALGLPALEAAAPTEEPPPAEAAPETKAVASPPATKSKS